MPTQMAKHHGAVVPLGKDKVIFYFSFLLRPETEDLGEKKNKKALLSQFNIWEVSLLIMAIHKGEVQLQAANSWKSSNSDRCYKENSFINSVECCSLF